MTGFGKGETAANGTRVAVEVRTVNGRYGDVSVHLPRHLSELEARIKDVVLESVSRGRVDVAVSIQGDAAGQSVPTLNEAVLTGYLAGIGRLRETFHLEGVLDLPTVASLPNLFSFDTPETDIEATWLAVEPACRLAVEECREMRSAEGDRLAEDFRARIARLQDLAGRIEALAPGRVTAVRQKLEERLAALIGPDRVDENRLLMEIALIAERSDITEECVRLKSHNDQFLSAIDSGEAVGRRLSFLLQEMLREVNTIGSKAGDADIAHLVVAMKEEIERLKEQALNVE